MEFNMNKNTARLLISFIVATLSFAPLFSMEQQPQLPSDILQNVLYKKLDPETEGRFNLTCKS